MVDSRLLLAKFSTTVIVVVNGDTDSEIFIRPVPHCGHGSDRFCQLRPIPVPQLGPIYPSKFTDHQRISKSTWLCRRVCVNHSVAIQDRVASGPRRKSRELLTDWLTTLRDLRS